jgi:hypothetical protein
MYNKCLVHWRHANLISLTTVLLWATPLYLWLHSTHNYHHSNILCSQFVYILLLLQPLVIYLRSYLSVFKLGINRKFIHFANNYLLLDYTACSKKKDRTFANTMFSNTLSFCSSCNVSNQVTHPYKTIGKIIVLCILIFKFLDSNLEDKRFCIYL